MKKLSIIAKNPITSAFLLTLGLAAIPAVPVMAEEQNDKLNIETAVDEHDEDGSETLSPDKLKALGVKFGTAVSLPLYETISVPGEVTLNTYKTSLTAPRISAQVVERFATLGDEVKPGTKLVTLSSVKMAEAQGQLILADRDWERTKSLGRNVVSEQKFLESRVAYQQAKARVLSYGMSEKELNTLVSDKNALATGLFNLFSTQAGRVIRDAFILGEFVPAGKSLFTISEEEKLWVEAQISPALQTRVRKNSPARISKGDTEISGRIISIHHQLNEDSRTLPVRIEIDNRNDLFHAGEFVSVDIQTGDGKEVLAVPTESIVLLEGNPVAFKVSHDEVEPVPLKVGETLDGWTEIHSGLQPGDEIVIEKSFLLKSLILKSRMGSGHGH